MTATDPDFSRREQEANGFLCVSVASPPNRLTPSDLAMFLRLGVSEELLAEAEVQRVTDHEAREKYGIRGTAAQDMSGIVFPYFNPVTGARVTARVRRDHPEMEKGKAKNKYISAYGDHKHLYFPPGAEAKLKNSDTLVLVEAEKSSLALTAWAERTGRDLMAVAMGGCWGWRGRIGKPEDARGERVDEMGPIPDLSRCDGRKVYVLLDANAATNPKVRQARTALVRELVTRDCQVFVCDLPQADGVNGPDDYIAACGDEAIGAVFAAARVTNASCEYGGGRFDISQNGVLYSAPADTETPKPPLWICAPLHIIAMTRDSKSSEWGRLLKWRDKDGVLHEWAMPLELLQGDGADVRRELARQGLSIAQGRSARELLATYLQVFPVDARAKCVDRLGWHGAVYVLPDQAVGHVREHVVFQNSHAAEPAFAVSGTIEEWRSRVASLAQGNSRVMFCISAAFAGALLEPSGEESGGFHLRGSSSTGKTTALRLAASVWGRPTKYCATWRATINGLEGLASLHNDGLLILDELNQVDPREAGEAAYLLANGRGKARATRHGTARQSANWRLLFLSAGEQSLSALMTQAGKTPTAGQEIRLAEIDADADAGMGAFEQLHGSTDPAGLALTLRDAAEQYYGAVGAEYLRLLVRDKAKLAVVLRKGMQEFVEEYVPKATGGQVERVARRFALVAIAGEMATRYGLTGWPQGEAIIAASKSFKSWLTAFGGPGDREKRALLDQVKAFLEQHGASRFQNANGSDSHRVVNRAGFYRESTDGQLEYLVFPQAFRDEVCAGFHREFAVKVLLEHGWLAPGQEKGKNRPTQKPRLPGMQPTRVYVLTAKIWEDGE